MKLILTVLLFVGMFMCTRGIGRIAAAHDWMHPFAIAGYLLGLAALAAAFAGLTDKKVVFIQNEKQAIIVLTVIIGIKIIIAEIYSTLKH